MLDALKKWYERPDEAETSLTAADDAAFLPPPEITWTLLGLLHYRERKLWAWEVLQEHFAEEIEPGPDRMVSIEDALEGRRDGTLPGCPEWEVSLDGNESFVTNRVTGERIHINALNGPEVISSSLFAEYLRLHGKPGPAEERLRELHPDHRGVVATINIMKHLDFFHIAWDDDPTDLNFELCGVLDEYTEPVESFLTAWESTEDRLALAAVIGDWPVVQSAAER